MISLNHELDNSRTYSEKTLWYSDRYLWEQLLIFWPATLQQIGAQLSGEGGGVRGPQPREFWIFRDMLLGSLSIFGCSLILWMSVILAAALGRFWLQPWSRFGRCTFRARTAPQPRVGWHAYLHGSTAPIMENTMPPRSRARPRAERNHLLHKSVPASYQYILLLVWWSIK